MNVNLKSLTLALALGIGFSACATLTPEETIELPSYPYTLTVDLQASDTKSSLEAKHQAPVLIFDAKAGYAVLGLEKLQLQTAQARLQSTDVLEPNPKIEAAQVTINDGSLGLWADGSLGLWADGSLGLWADGSLGLWADGSLGLWADGRFAPIPSNSKNWQSIKLQQGQARTTKLGKDVKIAVIDGGIDLAHPAFKRSLVPTGQMRDYIDGDNRPNDTTNGHGTAVAAIALQIAPGAKILPLRVIGKNGTGDADKLAQAINYAVSSNVSVINISLSVNGVSEPVKKALEAAAAKKIPVVLSAGNNNSGLNFPATLSFGLHSIISVGSVNADGVKSAFSNYGTSLEVSAPGEAITTAFPNNRRIVASGTSMAAAVVSGGLALAFGEGSTRLVGTPDQIAQILWLTADSSIYKLPSNSSFALTNPFGILTGSLGIVGRLNLDGFLKSSLK